MTKKMVGFYVFLIAAAFLLQTLSASVTLAEEKKELTVPENAKGFWGSLQGKVIAKDTKESSVDFKVEKVVKVSKENKSKTPDVLKGAMVRILAQMIVKEGKMVADEKQIDFINNLKEGAKLTVDVKSDGLFRLRMLDIPKEIGKK